MGMFSGSLVKSISMPRGWAVRSNSAATPSSRMVAKLDKVLKCHPVNPHINWLNWWVANGPHDLLQLLYRFYSLVAHIKSATSSPFNSRPQGSGNIVWAERQAPALADGQFSTGNWGLAVVDRKYRCTKFGYWVLIVRKIHCSGKKFVRKSGQFKGNSKTSSLPR